MIPRVINKASYYDVDLQLIRDHIREWDDEIVPDDYLKAISNSAWSWIENYLNRQLSKSLVELTIDEDIAGRPFYLPYGEVISIVDVKDKKSKPVSYQYDSGSERITLTRGFQTPYKIVYECGYLAYSVIPQSIRMAHLMLVATLYQQREDQSPIGVNSVSFNIKALLDTFRYRPI
ncbi:head-tail connector protein [Shewanella algae]|uniref:head-tail connector protein n=1 Tax=Shewanella algae TaxID=38313 RepID=UPI001BEDAF33|nr:head-tail connector protein [Shewanella algae]BCV28500.1 hypothetical protein TUM3811_23600 [Shewanella algae]